MLSRYGQREWLSILVVAALALAVSAYLHWWWVVGGVALVTLALLAFFRDPPRRIPAPPGLMVSPADGVVSSIHQIDQFDPFGEGALCIRIFLSVLDVHVNRSPCRGQVASVEHRDGRHLNALRPQAGDLNEATLVVLVDPERRRPVAAVKQIAGAIARRIVCAARPGQRLERGERFGMIKFGSTTDLYIPLSARPQPRVARGQRVRAGASILAEVASAPDGKNA